MPRHASTVQNREWVWTMQRTSARAVDARVHRGLGRRLQLALELVAVQVHDDEVAVGLHLGVGQPLGVISTVSSSVRTLMLPELPAVAHLSSFTLSITASRKSLAPIVSPPRADVASAVAPSSGVRSAVGKQPLGRPFIGEQPRHQPGPDRGQQHVVLVGPPGQADPLRNDPQLIKT